jgi:hypothetical protein
MIPLGRPDGLTDGTDTPCASRPCLRQLASIERQRVDEHMLQPHVSCVSDIYIAYVSSGCCKSRSDVAYVAMAIHVCCKCFISILHMLQWHIRMLQVYISKRFICFCKCFIWMLQMFQWLYIYVTSVYSKFICFRRMLQMCLFGCCCCYTHVINVCL